MGSRVLRALIPGLILACVVGAAPAHAAVTSSTSAAAYGGSTRVQVANSAASASVTAPIVPIGWCITEDVTGIVSALGPAVFVSAPGATQIEIPCNATLVQPLGRFTPITSPFGMRVHPITGIWTMHYGIDYARWGITGAEIRSIAAGTVSSRIDSFATTGSGNAISITHAGGYRSQYMHMIRPTTLNVGDRVAAGQVIGYVGSTGGSTGSHLHFEVRFNGTHIDPAPYLASAPFLG